MEVKLGTTDEGDDDNVQKINVEALDMDWLFENNNAKRMIEVLAKADNHSVLTSKSIKIFLNFMWNDYQ